MIYKSILVMLVMTHVLQSQAMRGDDTLWLPLFNGKDLTGWTGHPDLWDVYEDSAGTKLICGVGPEPTPGNHFIYSDSGFSDFILRTKSFIPSTVGGWNSGVIYRATIQGEYGASGIQADIGDYHLGSGYCEACGGCIPNDNPWDPGAGEQPMFCNPLQACEDARIHDDWNLMQIIADGTYIRHEVWGISCGEATLVGNMADISAGPVALQYHAGGDAGKRICFKDLYITPLNGSFEFPDSIGVVLDKDWEVVEEARTVDAGDLPDHVSFSAGRNGLVLNFEGLTGYGRVVEMSLFNTRGERVLWKKAGPLESGHSVFLDISELGSGHYLLQVGGCLGGISAGLWISR